MKRTTIEMMKSLIDDQAIKFLIDNEKEYNAMWNEYMKINGKYYIIGIDLANGEDRTVWGRGH